MDTVSEEVVAVTVTDGPVASEASAELELPKESSGDMECDTGELTVEACRSGQCPKL